MIIWYKLLTKTKDRSCRPTSVNNSGKKILLLLKLYPVEQRKQMYDAIWVLKRWALFSVILSWCSVLQRYNRNRDKQTRTTEMRVATMADTSYQLWWHYSEKYDLRFRGECFLVCCDEKTFVYSFQIHLLRFTTKHWFADIRLLPCSLRTKSHVIITQVKDHTMDSAFFLCMSLFVCLLFFLVHKIKLGIIFVLVFSWPVSPVNERLNS